MPADTKVPLLLCHWKADPPFDSTLSIYFDRVTRHTFGSNSSGVVNP